MKLISQAEALPLAAAIARLYATDPASFSPCAEAAEKQLRQLGWDMQWHEYAPDDGLPINCLMHYSGRYLTEYKGAHTPVGVPA